jgi:hypothetical protein
MNGGAMVSLEQTRYSALSTQALRKLIMTSINDAVYVKVDVRDGDSLKIRFTEFIKDDICVVGATSDNDVVVVLLPRKSQEKTGRPVVVLGH